MLSVSPNVSLIEPRYRRLSAAGASALSIWELRALPSDLNRLFGSGMSLQPGKAILTRKTFAFDEALCWCRSVADSAQEVSVVEVHMHGGFGVAAALRDFLNDLGWAEVDSHFADCAFLQATSPLAARIFSARLQKPWQSELDRIQQLPEPPRRQQIAALQRWNDWGQVLAQPPCLLIAGPPNAGKSTLFNAWLQERRVTANEAVGTTRDLVRAPLRLGQAAEAFVVELTDSAGVWDQAEGIDMAAVQMTEQALASAWRVIWVFDAALAPTDQLMAAVKQRPASDLLVVNRCDRQATWQAKEILPRPALRGDLQSQASLLAALERKILEQLGEPPPVGQLVAVSPAERAQLEAL
jgi:small GTP-binding protein